jgi:D-sedoheptulose 7-phosphate isomerase
MEHVNYFFADSVRDSISVKQAVLEDAAIQAQVCQVGELMLQAYRSGKKVIFAGNGGSAADAQHLAAEFVSRFEFDRPGLPSLSLSTDTSMLTAIGNDYGYEKLFSRQLAAQAQPGDVFVGITTSGRSKNIIEAFKIAGDLGVKTVGLCGAAGIDGAPVDYEVKVPSTNTARIQEVHIVIGHYWCGFVERMYFKG